MSIEPHFCSLLRRHDLESCGHVGSYPSVTNLRMDAITEIVFFLRKSGTRGEIQTADVLMTNKFPHKQ